MRLEVTMDTKLGKKLQNSFFKAFAGQTGVIESDPDKVPVCINTLSASCFSVQSRNAKFGCPPGELALLVEWLPAGLEHSPEFPVVGGDVPKETGVNPAKIPDQSTWVVFPKTWEGIPVYYKRGAAFFAC